MRGQHMVSPIGRCHPGAVLLTLVTLLCLFIPSSAIFLKNWTKIELFLLNEMGTDEFLFTELAFAKTFHTLNYAHTRVKFYSGSKTIFLDRK